MTLKEFHAVNATGVTEYRVNKYDKNGKYQGTIDSFLVDLKKSLAHTSDRTPYPEADKEFDMLQNDSVKVRHVSVDELTHNLVVTVYFEEEQ